MIGLSDIASTCVTSPVPCAPPRKRPEQKKLPGYEQWHRRCDARSPHSAFCCVSLFLVPKRNRKINQTVLVAPPQSRVSVLRNVTNMCGLWGHSRDKRRIRPFQDTLRTKCVRCDVPLKRVAQGKWIVFALSENSLEGLRPIPRNTVIPFARPSLASPFENAQVQNGDRQSRTSQDSSDAIVPEPSLSSDTREKFIAQAEEAYLLAQRASDHRIKLIHLEMAALYYGLANNENMQLPLVQDDDEVPQVRLIAR